MPNGIPMTCLKTEFPKETHVVNKKVSSKAQFHKGEVYFTDFLSLAQKVWKLLVAVKLFPLVLKVLLSISWLMFRLWKAST